MWIEVFKIIFAAVAAFAAGYGALVALRNWKLGEENRKIALANAENAAIWKRAELASSYLTPLFTDEELAFALRCIDWGTGTFPIPARHLPMFPGGEKTIEHDPLLLAKAMIPQLSSEVSKSPQGMLYRLALDALFTRLEWIGYRVSSKLIKIEDVPDLKPWLEFIASWGCGPCSHKSIVFLPFLDAAGYKATLNLMAEFGIAVPVIDPKFLEEHDFASCGRKNSLVPIP